MIAAFLLPVMIYMTAIAYPFGLWPFSSPSGCLYCPTRDPSFLVTGHLLGALFIFVTIAGSLYHGIFRFQTTLRSEEHTSELQSHHDLVCRLLLEKKKKKKKYNKNKTTKTNKSHK